MANKRAQNKGEIRMGRFYTFYAPREMVPLIEWIKDNCDLDSEMRKIKEKEREVYISSRKNKVAGTAGLFSAVIRQKLREYAGELKKQIMAKSKKDEEENHSKFNLNE